MSGVRASKLIADRSEAANGSAGRQSIETKDQSADIDFSFELWREIFKALVHNEKRALEKFQTIEFELEVTQRWSNLARSECIFKMDLVAEPGKPVRVAALSMPQRGADERIANENKKFVQKR